MGELRPTSTEFEETRPVWPEHEIDNSGIYFTPIKQVLMADKYINVDFGVPFPSYNTTLNGKNITEQIEQISTMLYHLWTRTGYNCFLHSALNDTDHFKYDTLLDLVRAEHRKAMDDVTNIRDEIHEVLSSRVNPIDTYGATSGRSRRAIGLGAIAALTVGSLAAGLGTGSALGCAFKSFLGGCGKQAKENKENLKILAQNFESLKDAWAKTTLQNQQKFYLVGSELRDLKKTQQEMSNTVNLNFEIIDIKFEALINRTRLVEECEKFLYVRDQRLHIETNLVSMLLTLYNNIKAYRSAAYAYRITILNSITTMTNKRIPMALLPKEDFESILLDISDELVNNGQKLTLAIPPKQILTYYETQLLQRVETTDIGLVFQVSIPLASVETEMTVFKATPIPMPDENNPGMATIWDIETEYLAQQGDNQVLLTKEQLDTCVGSPAIGICTNGFPIEKNHKSCLSSLIYRDTHAVVKNCNIKSLQLPMYEKAENLGHGVWLITSFTSNYQLTESIPSEYPGQVARTKNHKGCLSCIFILECGHTLSGPNIKITSDLSACKRIPPIRIDLKLSDPLKRIFTEIPELKELPHMPTINAAKEEMMKDIRKKLSKLPTPSFNEAQLSAIAMETAYTLQTIRPQFSDNFTSSDSTFRQIVLWIFSAIFAFILHTLITYAYHKYLQVHTKFPFRSQFRGRTMFSKPMTVVDQDDYNYLKKHPDCPLWKETFVLPISRATALKDDMASIHAPVNPIPSFVYPQLATLRNQQVQLQTLPTDKGSKFTDFDQETSAPEYSVI